MKKIILLSLVLFLILSLGLFGCGYDQNNTSSNSEEPEVTEALEREGDFEVQIEVVRSEEGLTVEASITYLGDEDKVDIYHGGSIFYFNIYEQDGDFEYLGAMDAQLLTTELLPKEPHNIEINYPILEELEPGIYEFEAEAVFSLDEEHITDTMINIPASVMVSLD